MNKTSTLEIIKIIVENNPIPNKNFSYKIGVYKGSIIGIVVDNRISKKFTLDKLIENLYEKNSIHPSMVANIITTNVNEFKNFWLDLIKDFKSIY